MKPFDLGAIQSVAAEVHPAYPEEGAVFAERLALYPRGCFVLEQEGKILGYVVSHPWKAYDPPSLNTLIGAIPSPPGTYYLHDIALLSAVRGKGYGDTIFRRLLAEATDVGLTTISLVAVNGTTSLWARYGFSEVADTALGKIIASYGSDAAFMVRNLKQLSA